MERKIELIIELFNEKPVPQSDKLQLFFKKPYSESEQIKLVPFFDKSVQAKIYEHVPEGGEQTTDVIIDDIFHVTSAKPDRLANGNKTGFVIEKMHDRENHEKAVHLYQKECVIVLEIIQNELPGMAEDEEEIETEEENDLQMGFR